MKKECKPFVKWAGGKRKLASQIIPRILDVFDPEHNKYIEPFVGAGAILFELMPKEFIINDKNEELMSVYSVLSTGKHEELMVKLDELEVLDAKKYYYNIRNNAYSGLTNSQVDIAARFIYLNKSGFNGLYRVNSKGGFNVPIGLDNNPKLYERDNLLGIAKYFQSSRKEILQGSYQQTSSNILPGDCIYIDPPYHGGFVSYTKDGFSEQDQIELRDWCIKMKQLGAHVLVSNSDTEFIRDIYAGNELYEINALRTINTTKQGSRTANELLIIMK